ncbi:restriction endonuclease [Streptomyces sp. NPDC006207]
MVIGILRRCLRSSWVASLSPAVGRPPTPIVSRPRRVSVEPVHALAGLMEDNRCAKGILITTSWFGRASHDFARQHGRLQLIEGPELKYLVKEHLGKDVIPGPVPPKRPSR